MEDNFALGYTLGADNGNNSCNDGMYGGGAWLWILVIFALLGWGGNGWGGFGGGNGGGYVATAATQADIQRGFDTRTVISKLDGINSGLCDGFYAMNNGMLSGFNGVGNAICNMGYQTAQLVNGVNTNMNQGFTGVTAGLTALGNQMSDCCCGTQRQIERGFCDTNYNMATNTRDVIQSTHSDTDRIIARIDAMENTRMQEKISALQSENQSLKFAASQNEQNAFIAANQNAQTAELIRRISPMPVPSYQVPAPYPYCVSNTCGCM